MALIAPWRGRNGRLMVKKLARMHFLKKVFIKPKMEHKYVKKRKKNNKRPFSRSPQCKQKE